MNARDVLASVTGFCDACGAGPGVVCDPFCVGVAAGQDEVGTYTSVNGVEHLLVTSGSGCATCGKPHLDKLHRLNVERYLGGSACEMVAQVGGYPYPCLRGDREPAATVVVCRSHHTWWVEQ